MCYSPAVPGRPQRHPAQWSSAYDGRRFMDTWDDWDTAIAKMSVQMADEENTEELYAIEYTCQVKEAVTVTDMKQMVKEWREYNMVTNRSRLGPNLEFRIT